MLTNFASKDAQLHNFAGSHLRRFDTDDGVTVSGFWNSEKNKEFPTGYEMDASRQYLKRVTLHGAEGPN
jgi:hypothetical protein